VVWFRGPNVFSGYLKDEQKTRAALKDGWFITGDLGRFDEEGFLYIEGRLSRFSKIGGEMVPHGRVEQKVNEAYGIEQTEGPLIIVVGVPDSSKGEALVLLTSIDINGDELREKLYTAGLPNLWIPKIIRRVEKNPAPRLGQNRFQGLPPAGHGSGEVIAPAGRPAGAAKLLAARGEGLRQRHQERSFARQGPQRLDGGGGLFLRDPA